MSEFERSTSVFDSLQIGKKKLIIDWLIKIGQFPACKINDNMTIDGLYSIVLNQKNLVEFPEYIQFNECLATFSCSNNRLTSLRGCPKIVRGSFYCHHNDLNSLDYSPQIVCGDFKCGDNKIKFNEDDVKEHSKVKCKIICYHTTAPLFNGTT